MKTIRKYFDQVLRPFLKDHLDPAFENDVFNDVERRLVSIFKNWGTEKFRKTLFLPVIELASFYQPAHANLDARAIVVAGVRNGMIEDLHTPYPYNPMFAGTPRITQEGMRKITSWSSLFFSRREIMAAINEQYPTDSGDIFQCLANQYPEAWRRIEALAMLRYTKRRQDIQTGHERWVQEVFEGFDYDEGLALHYESGYSPAIGQQLSAALHHLANKESGVFFSPSFRGVTRNPEKLLRVIEHVLACNGIFVTNNYVIRRDCVLRRHPLVDGSSRDIKQHFAGLETEHVSLLNHSYFSF